MSATETVEGRWRDAVLASKHVITPGARDAVSVQRLADCLLAHSTGDWGVVSVDDMVNNTRAAVGRGRVLSAYAIDPHQPSAGHGRNTIWIITEGDRSQTTVMLPEEYRP